MGKRRWMATGLLTGALLAVGAGAVPVLGHEMPAPGPGFGTHISQMAPDHPREHGAMFGHCVSMMARGIEHDCHHD